MANKYSKYSKVSKSKLFKRIHRLGARSCARKRSFENSEQAAMFLKRNGYTGRPYRCRHCYKWHNTSKK